ncbi:MAG: hypothetical protein VZR28_12200, partial [Candidatus Cryptobacteroides sp.]|nr:hypothetical protein [Candidatus Cryptobacteroides sp.]
MGPRILNFASPVKKNFGDFCFKLFKEASLILLNAIKLSHNFPLIALNAVKTFFDGQACSTGCVFRIVFRLFSGLR